VSGDEASIVRPVVAAVAVVLPVGLVVLGVVADQVVEGEAVVEAEAGMATGDVEGMGNRAVVADSRQRYGLLLVTLAATFFFFGIAEPGNLQRVIGSVLVGSALLLALYAVQAKPRRQRLAVALVAMVVFGVIVASVAWKGKTVVAALVARVVPRRAPAG